MASLFNKLQEAVKILANRSTYTAKNSRQLQFEADIHRLFLYTSYNHLGREADEADIEEIIEMASKSSAADQQVQVQENIHSQIRTFSAFMDDILLPYRKREDELAKSSPESTAPRPSGLSLAVGGRTPVHDYPAVHETEPFKRSDLSQRLKEHMGYTLQIKPSQIPHRDADQGLYVDGEAEVGAVIAFYPGVVYSPAYYRYIPGYPKVDAQNCYLITRYDGTVINAQPWQIGSDARELWDGSGAPVTPPISPGSETGSDKMWRFLSKPLNGTGLGSRGEILERRNPLALGHFANHPAKEMVPNVMVCPYDFPLVEKEVRPYIPNVAFGNGDEVNMKRFGSFWFKSWKSNRNQTDVPILKSLVLVATRAIQNEEVLLNYRLSNSKQRPTWYTPVDEEEDRRRWS